MKQTVLNEQNTNNIKGKIMNFKSRLIEESFGDFTSKLGSGLGAAFGKTKEFAKNNPGVAAGLGGAGLGAAYNYLTGGADDLQAERQAELKNFKNEELPSMIRNEHSLSKEEFEKYFDNYQDLNDMNPFTSFFGDTLPFTDDAVDNTNNMTQLRLENPNAFPNIKEAMSQKGNWNKIGDFELNQNSSVDNNWAAYQNHLKQTIHPSEQEIKDYTEHNPEVNTKTKGLKSDVENATRDSYIHKALGGAALGTGGVFAKRKLDERKI
jgi:hypothetical protein